MSNCNTEIGNMGKLELQEDLESMNAVTQK